MITFLVRRRPSCSISYGFIVYTYMEHSYLISYISLPLLIVCVFFSPLRCGEVREGSGEQRDLYECYLYCCVFSWFLCTSASGMEGSKSGVESGKLQWCQRCPNPTQPDMEAWYPAVQQVSIFFCLLYICSPIASFYSWRSCIFKFFLQFISYLFFVGSRRAPFFSHLCSSKETCSLHGTGWWKNNKPSSAVGIGKRKGSSSPFVWVVPLSVGSIKWWWRERSKDLHEFVFFSLSLSLYSVHDLFHLAEREGFYVWSSGSHSSNPCGVIGFLTCLHFSVQKTTKCTCKYVEDHIIFHGDLLCSVSSWNVFLFPVRRSCAERNKCITQCDRVVAREQYKRKPLRLPEWEELGGWCERLTRIVPPRQLSDGDGSLFFFCLPCLPL